MDWYEEHIEEPVRGIVKTLRDNGFNTTCSCGHEMYVEGDLIADYELQRLHKILWDYCSENNKSINYEIKFDLKVSEGFLLYTRFYIEFK